MKPDSQKRIRPKAAEAAARVRNIARRLYGRVFVTGDAVFLVRGSPEFRSLYNTLKDIEKVPPPEKAPSPLQLGFTSQDVSAINSVDLAESGRALMSWRTLVAAMEKAKRSARKQSGRLVGWKGEIETLDRQLQILHESLRAVRQKSPPSGSPYLIDSEALSQREGIRRTIRLSVPVSPVAEWYEDLVFWIAGPAGFHRLCRVLQDRFQFLSAPPLVARMNHLLKAARRFEDHSAQYTHLKTDLREEFGEVLASLPNELYEFLWTDASRIQSSRVVRKRVIGGCTNEILWQKEGLPGWAMGGTAALCATDRSDAPIPVSLLLPVYALDADSHGKALSALSEESNKPGYDLLLVAIATPPPWKSSSFGPLRELRQKGVGLEILTTIQSWRRQSLLNAFVNRPRSLERLVRFVQKLEAQGLEPDNRWIREIADAASKRPVDLVLGAFERWAELPARGPGRAEWASSFRETILAVVTLQEVSEPFSRFLSRWSQAPRRIPPMPNRPLDAPAELAYWLDLLAYYQGLAEETPHLPAAVAENLQAEGREAEELQYLLERQRENLLTASMARRLATLEGGRRHFDSRKIIPHVQDLCAVTALQAVRRAMSGEAEAFVATLSLSALPAHLSAGETAMLLNYIRSLEGVVAERLHEILLAWDQHGLFYKRVLTENAGWIAAAKGFGIDTDGWFGAPMGEIDLRGIRVTIGPAADPFRTLLMGSYFDTCLNIDDGSNRDSVVSNAYDANKMVLFVIDSDQEVIARKLIALNGENSLIGYRTYFSEGAPEYEVGDLLDVYCGHLASRLNIRMVNFGIPANIGGAFWYNDGARPWSWLARAAARFPEFDLQRLRQPETRDLFDLDTDGAADRRRKECRGLVKRWLREGGIDMGVNFSFLDRAEVMEEALAWLAFERKDRVMANLLHQNAITSRGGEIAAAVLFQLNPEYDEVFFRNNFLTNPKILAFLWAADPLKAIRALFQWSRDWGLEGERFGPLMASSEEVSRGYLHELARIHSRKETQDSFDEGEYHATLVASMRTSASLPIHQVVSLSKIPSRRSSESAKRRFISWMLPPSGPRSALTVADLKGISLGEEPPESSVRNEEHLRCLDTATLLALRYNSPSSTRFLVQRASSDLHALLALALRDPVHYRGTIWALSVKRLETSAAVLALVQTGDLDTRRKEVLRQTGNVPLFSENTEMARRVVASCRSFDFGYLVHEGVISRMGRGNILLVLMNSLWAELESSLVQKRLPSFLARLEKHIPNLARLDLDFGLGLWLSAFYARAGSADRGVLAGAIRRLGLQAADLLVVDALCDHNVFAEPTLPGDISPIDLTDHRAPDVLHLSFLSPSGELYPISRSLQISEHGLTGVFDGYLAPAHLVRWMRFLAGKLPSRSSTVEMEPRNDFAQRLWQIVKNSGPG